MNSENSNLKCHYLPISSIPAGTLPAQSGTLVLRIIVLHIQAFRVIDLTLVSGPRALRVSKTA